MCHSGYQFPSLAVVGHGFFILIGHLSSDRFFEQEKAKIQGYFRALDCKLKTCSMKAAIQ